MIVFVHRYMIYKGEQIAAMWYKINKIGYTRRSNVFFFNSFPCSFTFVWGQWGVSGKKKQFEWRLSEYTISFALFHDLRFFKMTSPLGYLPGNVNVIHNSFEYVIEHLVAFVILYRYMKKKHIYICIVNFLI